MVVVMIMGRVTGVHRRRGLWVIATTLVVGCASRGSANPQRELTADSATSSGGRASAHNAGSGGASSGGTSSGGTSSGGAADSGSVGGPLHTPGLVRCYVLGQVPSDGYHDCDISKQEGCCLTAGTGISRIALYGKCSDGGTLTCDFFWACDDDSDCPAGEQCTSYLLGKKCVGPSSMLDASAGADARANGDGTDGGRGR